MKIYTEVIIDMNPESSSYGKHLHEESFEYNGPMALAGAVDDRIRATSGYRDHRWHAGLPIMKRDAGGVKEFWIYDAKATKVLQKVAFTDMGWERAENRAQDWSTRLETEAAPGYEAPTTEVTPDIKYSEFSKFLDPSGNVSDMAGFMGYLKQVDPTGMGTKSESDLEALIAKMPNLGIGEGEMAKGKGQFQADVYGIQSQIGAERKGLASATGISGVYSPTATGFGTKAEDTFAAGAYKDIGEAQEAGGDAYGLGEGKEQDLLDWLNTLS